MHWTLSLRKMKKNLKEHMKKTPLCTLAKGNIISIQSHVSFGCAGNSASVFILQRLGYNAVAVNTVLYSNHTGYDNFAGCVVAPKVVASILSGLEEIGVLNNSLAVIWGYLGSAGTGKIVLDKIAKIKTLNKKTIFVCDPVIGDSHCGMFVDTSVAKFIRDFAVGQSHIITPNLFELEYLVGKKLSTKWEVVLGARELIKKGCSIVLITSAEFKSDPLSTNKTIDMIAVSKDSALKVSTPKFNIPSPSGAGDAATALFTSYYLQSGHMRTALCKTASALYEIFKKTYHKKTWELQIIASGDDFVKQSKQFKAEKIIFPETQPMKTKGKKSN